MTGSSSEPLPEETGPGVVVPIEDGFFRERTYQKAPFGQAARRFVITLAMLGAGVSGLIAVIGFGIGSFQGTYPTFDGQVWTCGYASVESDCQAELRSTVETRFGVDLGDDVRVSELRKSGILSIEYTARIEFPSSSVGPSTVTSVAPVPFGNGLAARGDSSDGTIVVYLRTNRS